MSGFQPYLGISASAGSGKTFQLAHRFLSLIAMGQAPDRIGAYTFSRKAAGSIFDEIIHYLQEAAGSEEKAEATSRILQLSRGPADYEADIRTLFAHMHRLRIGTLDSRISRMLSAAAVELKLPADFMLLDSTSAEYLRLQAQVLNRLFQGQMLSASDRDAFLQLFEEATYGQAEKHFHRRMQDYLSKYRITFLEHPEPEVWGRATLSDPPETIPDSEREVLATALMEKLEELELKTKARNAIAKIIQAALEYGPGSIWSKDAPDGAIWDHFIANDSPTIPYGRGVLSFPEDNWQDLRRLWRHPLAVELEKSQRQTRAIYGFLLAYEHTYRRHMASTGILAFEDACTLMASFDLLSTEALAYRLDGEIDHWLLDEFQDTSPLQWHVLQPFVEEALQDPELRRSFFYVGDVKQAIYGWRGGDAGLFDRIREEWTQIDVQPLNDSWRSAPPVLDLVNTLLRDLPCEEDVPAEAIQRWNATFTAHTAARPSLSGHARVMQALEDGPGMEDLVLQRILEMPREQETAILVRSNDEGATYANRLREAGIPVSLEGAADIRDDTGVDLLLAALHYAAHPGDRHSHWMTRLGGLSVDPANLLTAVRHEGFTQVLRSLIPQLSLTDDAAFTQSRLQRLLGVALQFDALGDPDIDRFLAFIENAKLKENEATGVVRVMTIHQSKGLGFDAVILPIRPTDKFIKIDPGKLTAGKEPGEPLAILPPKDVCEAIPEYRDRYRHLEAEGFYGNLCTLYVALTRAKQSLQVILPATAKPGNSGNVTANWLTRRLEAPMDSLQDMQVLYEQGAPDWNRPPHPPDPAAATPFPLQPGPSLLPRLEPSQAGQGPESAAGLFQEISRDGRSLGTRVHELLSQVEWGHDMDVEAMLAEAGEDPASEAAAHVRQAVASGALDRPTQAHTAWREKKFETVLPTGWVTGIFDRVVLLENEAWIQDFKTNRSTGPDIVDHYRPQMDLYRTVLADMLNLPPENIRCQLVFTRTGEVAEI